MRQQNVQHAFTRAQHMRTTHLPLVPAQIMDMRTRWSGACVRTQM